MANALMRAAQWLGDALTSRAYDFNDPRLSAWWGGGKRTPGARNSVELLAAYQTHPWFRAVTHKIGSLVAAVPWKLYRAEGKKAGAVRRHFKGGAGYAARQATVRKATRAGALVEVDDHPLLDLLATPNDELSGLSMFLLWQVWTDVVGEGFIAVERSADGTPETLWPIPPHWMQRTPTAEEPTFHISGGGKQWTLPRTDVVWLRDPSVINPYGRGKGKGAALSDELNIDEAAAKRTAAFYANGAMPDFIMALKGVNSKPALKAAREEFESRHRGPWNAFRSFWTSADATVTRLDTSFKDLQLIQLRQWQRDAVIQVYGIPPEVMGIIENSNRATIDGAEVMLARYVLLPRLEAMRAELQARLVPLFGDAGLVLDFENPVPPDKAFTLEVMTARPDAYSENEVRELTGHEPREGFDEIGAAKPKRPAAGEDAEPEDGERGGDPPWVRNLVRELRAATSKGTPPLGAFQPCQHPEEEFPECKTDPVKCLACGCALGCYFEPQPFYCLACQRSGKHAGARERRLLRRGEQGARGERARKATA